MKEYLIILKLAFLVLDVVFVRGSSPPFTEPTGCNTVADDLLLLLVGWVDRRLERCWGVGPFCVAPVVIDFIYLTFTHFFSFLISNPLYIRSTSLPQRNGRARGRVEKCKDRRTGRPEGEPSLRVSSLVRLIFAVQLGDTP